MTAQAVLPLVVDVPSGSPPPKFALGSSHRGSRFIRLGATGVFGRLQDALNTIWETSPLKTGGIWGIIRSRLFSLAAVFGTGCLLLVSLAVSAAIGGIIDIASQFETLEPFLIVIGLVTSAGVTTVLFALMFKILPDVEIAWRDVWFGAFVTAVLFVIGKFGIGLYLSMSDLARHTAPQAH